MLQHQPSKPNCATVFWPFAPASLRIYCAQERASQAHTLEDLMAAIALVDALGPNSPLAQSAINPLINQWSTQVLDLAELAFHDGKLDRAIQFAQRIPAQATVHELVQQRIARWRQIWTQGEAIYQKAEAELKQGEWRRAFSIMIQLLEVDNRYWSRTQYEAFNQRIFTAQEDERTLAKARQLFRKGDQDNLIKAIDLIQQLDSTSVFHKQSRETLNQIALRLVDLAEVALQDRDMFTAIELLELIPQEAKIWADVQEFVEVVYATSSEENPAAGLEAAIAQVQALPAKNSLYERAQALSLQWQQDIDDAEQLAQAQAEAAGGDPQNLTLAIDQARTIPPNSSYGQEAQQDIDDWLYQLETQEDQPILDRAEQLAAGGGRTALQAAVAQAQQIRTGRPLYGEAQAKISDWQFQLQQLDASPGRVEPAPPTAEGDRVPVVVDNNRPPARKPEPARTSSDADPTQPRGADVEALEEAGVED